MLIRMRRAGRGWTLALAAAGHPPAILVSGGTASQLGGGAMLGGWADAPVERHEAEIGAGDTLVLFTDGWLEVGPVEQHRDPEALAEMAQSLADVELHELTDRLRRDALSRGGGTLRDDLVVLAVRPEDSDPRRRNALIETAVAADN
jgi:sigma-B regulation protein RsbU (phosphoserine phosphatase)